MRPFSHLCIFLFGTRTQGYTSPDDCPACWVTKACTFSSVYFPSPANLSSLLHSGTTSAGAQKVLPFPAASWDNKGSYGIALKGLGTCKEKSMSTEPPSCLPCPSCLIGPSRLDTELDLCRDCWTRNARLPPTMQVHTLFCCLFSGVALPEKKFRHASINLSALGAHFLKEHFPLGPSAVTNGQLNFLCLSPLASTYFNGNCSCHVIFWRVWLHSTIAL